MIEFSSKNSLGIDLQRIHESIMEQNFAALKQLQDELEINEMLSYDSFDASSQNVVAIGSSIGLYKSEPSIVDLLALDETLAEILVPKKANDHTIFALDKAGVIHVICAKTMMTISQWSEEKVVDMALIEDENDSSIKIMMVTQKMGKCKLQIRECPDFNSLYELEVRSFCRLLDVALDQETPLFVEGSYQTENDENVSYNNVEASSNDAGCVQMLRIRGICEGNPEARLMRLLARKKFAEAENFAQLNRLSMEDVHHSKAQWIILPIYCAFQAKK